jgi:hypothetical protein
MTNTSKKNKKAFRTRKVYRHKEPHAFTYLRERTTFWIAVLSLFAFVTGNMMGQNGWHVFWKSVLGNGLESTIAFDGFVPPLAEVPDFACWAKYGGSIHLHTFREIPKDCVKPFPAYDPTKNGNTEYDRAYLVENLGTYKNGRGEGSHPGMDLVAAIGTPVHAVANGIVTVIDNDAGGYGNYIVIKHPNVPDPDNAQKLTSLYSVYAHLQGTLPAVGDIVNKGDVIGTSGMTGFATGPHLHFQMDRDEAPWHPYWPFTGAEARSAGLNMAQAVDAGLHRERGLQYTIHPMLYIQSHTVGRPRVAMAESSSSQRAPKPKMTVQERRQVRLAKRNITETTIVAIHTPDDIKPESVFVQSAAASSEAKQIAPTNVSKILIRHDGSFSAERMREKVTIMLLNEKGDLVENPENVQKIYLRTAYGKAEFYPDTISASNFVKGKAEIEMLPIGQTTIIIEAKPMGAMSEPMVYTR